MTAGARGIDVSSWQHPAGEPIDWHAVRDSGVTFAIVKATQGADYANPWFSRDTEDAFAAGLLVGAYHFYIASVDPLTQATNFKTAIAGSQLALGLWLDFEVAPGPQWTLAGYVNGFIEACKPELPGVGLACTEDMWAELKGANVAPAALWDLGGVVAREVPGATLVQDTPGQVPGVPADVDRDILVTVRGINLPSSPPPRPTSATVHSSVPEPEPEEDGAEASATE